MPTQNIRDEWGELNLKNRDIVNDYIKKSQNKENQHYMLTISRDGEEPVRSVIFYDNAIDAVSVYNSYTDWGFAKEFLTVTLYEPNGQKQEKILKRPPGIEAAFMRSQYIEMAKILLGIKNSMPKNKYEELVINIANLFAIDNKRFDEKRFFINTGCYKED
jgi:hypothetical protein